MISVIIPTLNEQARLPALLAALARETPAPEIIVVDGGSRDGTRRIARDAGVQVLRTAPGRGVQLAAGAEQARGRILLFLHADVRFPTGGLRRIGETLAGDPALVGGNFRLVFDGERRFSGWLTGFYAWFRGHGLYYGDSGIFAHAGIYRALGGIRPVALMEDYDFTRRLERAGPTCCIEDPPLVTSSRRFEGRHPAAVFLGWLEIHALYHLGVSDRLLARRYEQQRRGVRRRAADAQLSKLVAWIRHRISIGRPCEVIRLGAWRGVMPSHHKRRATTPQNPAAGSQGRPTGRLSRFLGASDTLADGSPSPPRAFLPRKRER